METISLIERKSEKIIFNKLLDEAYDILKKSEEFSPEQRAKLASIFNQIASWTGNHNPEEQYYEDFQNTILAMTQLNFTQRLALTSNIKSIQNFFSVAINTLNEKLQDKVVSNSLLSNLLDTLSIKDTLVIGTDKNGVINFSKIAQKDISNICGKCIDDFFHNPLDLIEQVGSQGLNNWLNIQLKGIYDGVAQVKLVFPAWEENSNTILYIIKLPESNNVC